MVQERAEKLVVIHTGFHKTGSSSIQHSLAYNRELLAGRGYFYPEFIVNGVEFYNRSVPLYGFFVKILKNLDIIGSTINSKQIM